MLPSRLSKCPQLCVHHGVLAPFLVRRRWLNSWWKCRLRQGTLSLSWPCKPWGGRQHVLCSSSSPPVQGGIQILDKAEARQGSGCGRPCDHQRHAPAVLRRVRGGASVSVLRQLCNDRWSRQFSLEVPQVQFLQGCGRLCDHAAPFQQVFVEYVEVPQLQKTGDSPGAVLGLVGTPVVVQRQVLGFDSAENFGSTASAVLWQDCRCSRCSSSTRFGRPRDLAATISRRQLEVPQIQLLNFEVVVKAFCRILRHFSDSSSRS